MKRLCYHAVVCLVICLGLGTFNVTSVGAFDLIFNSMPIEERPRTPENQGVRIINEFQTAPVELRTTVQTAAFSVNNRPSASTSKRIERWEDIPHQIITGDGLARVLVMLHAPDAAELLHISMAIVPPVRDGMEASLIREKIRDADAALANAVYAAGAAVLDRLTEIPHRVARRYWMVPLLALDITPQALQVLQADSRVKSIYPNDLIPLPDYSVSNPLDGPDTSPNDTIFPRMSDTVALIGAEEAWAQGYTGEGWDVAVLDTGIRNTHEFFQGKDITEACFSADAQCPNGQTSMTGPGAARHYDSSYAGYDHGTHVAGTAAGRKPDDPLLAGVARDAGIIAVNVFSRFSARDCDGTPCVMAYTSDTIAGMEHVYGLRFTRNIGAVNLSLGGGEYSSFCDNRPEKQIIDALQAAHIPVAIASGNDRWCGKLGAPGCVSTAITVMASDKSDQETGFNNWHKTVGDIFAPGASIHSATGDSDNSYSAWNGTSMATPHVAGGLTLMRHFDHTLSTDTLLERITEHGPSITTRCPFPDDGDKPRIYVNNFSDDISLKRALNPALDWFTGGDAEWFGQSDEFYDGDSSARTGDITHNQRTHLHTRVVGPGILEFHWKVSSEAEHDRLRFGFASNPFSLTFIDSISGDVDWDEKSYPVPDGLHYLLWVYEKNDSIDEGLDAGWLDRVVWTQQGELTVTLEPQAARDAGAQWRRTGTSTWHNSGTTEDSVPTGSHTVEFKDISGWIKPASQNVTVTAGQTATLTGTYTEEPSGSLIVTIEPEAARNAGAQWRRTDTDSWFNSSDRDSPIPPGDYEVEFKPIFGWVTPDTQVVTIYTGEIVGVTGVYVSDDQNGALTVTLEPEAARNAGAQWRRTDTDSWFNSGDTEFPIPPGDYEVEFKPIFGWVTPDTQAVTISSKEIYEVTGTYVSEDQNGALTVTLEPQAARDDGAQWRRTGTSIWHNSGTTEDSVPTGSHTVEFKDVSGWTKPANQNVTVTAGQTATLTGTYTEAPQIGSLTVTIEPEAVRDDGAQWRRTGTSTWYNSGTKEDSVPVGSHTVEFKNVNGWTKPANQNVTITADQTATLSATYTEGRQKRPLPGIMLLLLDE